ncbi:chitinase precursor fragment, truncated [Plasmodium sp. gorilla clade G2]|uniref:chitinase precursor fragment, truncated n=1 Tax=Plasmodium sp. gorilla clade G2 TaxID=880535 RepID=UPI000D22CA35|nr:chitinase precursor fragment, truncated [Plasmodium sp. gorilla clade G2]SOV12763.1 chitinase precursor fragment, truncated [Plasmodium sp. gorilla clade G2]
MKFYISLFVIIFSFLSGFRTIGLKGMKQKTTTLEISTNNNNGLAKLNKSLSHVQPHRNSSQRFNCKCKYVYEDGTQEGNVVEG